MKALPLLLLALFFDAPLAPAADPVVINRERIHLRSGDVPEWEDFAGEQPRGKRLALTFLARTNRNDWTLFVQQDDVRQDWRVELNGHRVGNLFLMEADLIHTLKVPAGTVREGENRLVISPPRANDDIFLGEITLLDEPPDAAIPEATLEFKITDSATRAPLPCRLTVVNEKGALAPLAALPGDVQATPAVRPGVAYGGAAPARLGLPAGRYTVFVSRGFEYSVATQQVQIAAGEVQQLELALTREVPTPGFVSCDTHVHTFTHSRHGDSTIEERMLTLAGEGIEMPMATDHNLHVDYAKPAKQMRVDRYFTPVMGNEVTTVHAHFNIFPVAPGARLPNHKLNDWPELMKEMRATPGVRVVVLNHPRNVHNAFQPFAATNFNALTGENKRGPEFTFDAMEVLNSSAQQSDYMLVFRDWFALLNYGYRITGVGSSDGHDVSRYIVGQGRTYIACPEDEVAQLNVPLACSNLVAGRALVSMGLLVDLRVQGWFGVGDLATNLNREVEVEARVLGPSWVQASRVDLFANGTRLRGHIIDERQTTKPGVKATIRWKIPRPSHDVHLVAMATGPAVTAPFWAIPRPYQPSSPQWTGRVIASTNPIWLDADGDGRFSAARQYARQLVAQHGTTPERIVPALSAFDEAVAVQAASLCAAAGADVIGASFGEALRSAAPKVRKAFADYAATR